MGGIAIQETFIIGFIGLTIHLHRKLLHIENTGQQLGKMANLSFNWRWLFYTMYFALTMITVSEHEIHSRKSCLVFLTLFPLHNRFVSLSDWQSIHMAQVQTSLQTHMSGTNMSLMPFLCSSPLLSSTYSTPAAFSRGQMADFDTRRKLPRWKRSRRSSRKKTDLPPLATTCPWLRIRIITSSMFTISHLCPTYNLLLAYTFDSPMSKLVHTTVFLLSRISSLISSNPFSFKSASRKRHSAYLI